MSFVTITEFCAKHWLSYSKPAGTKCWRPRRKARLASRRSKGTGPTHACSISAFRNLLMASAPPG